LNQGNLSLTPTIILDGFSFGVLEKALRSGSVTDGSPLDGMLNGKNEEQVGLF
jgi:hypothetical protein